MDMSKTILTELDGFTPVIDCLVKEYGLVTAAVFGRIWRYCQMETGVCQASLDTMAEYIGLDKATIMRHAKKLVDAGYLKDLSPDLRNHPHTYADTGKVTLTSKISVAQNNAKKERVADDNASVAQSNASVAENQLKIDIKKDSKIQREEQKERIKENFGNIKRNSKRLSIFILAISRVIILGLEMVESLLIILGIMVMTYRYLSKGVAVPRSALCRRAPPLTL